ncbi:HET-domain-containing protein [Stipitochalara longipes BDJ]|nr:HET-domain-containing protein [Stipitochalara longipes BDJ]
MATNTQPALYSWEALKHPDSIRLLNLHPSLSPCDEIMISIRESRLSVSPSYEAVSYCWATEDGDDSRNCTISCDGTLIFITRNCEAALKRIRNDKERILWVDAICINQAGDCERSHQVGLMGSIYKNAFGVLIYLGEPTSDLDPDTELEVTDIFLDFLGAFFTEADDRIAQGMDITDSSRYQEFIRNVQAASRGHSLQLLPLIRGLRDISSRRWWTRIWVIQEAYLAVKQGVTVLWGPRDTPYPYFLLFNQVIDNLRYLLGILELRDMGYHFRTIAHCTGSLDHKDEKLAYILKALNNARSLQASDSRDKVFGLIGLIDPDAQVLSSPDYNKSAIEVFSLVSRSLVERGKILDPLYYLSESESSLCPSWVIDWSEPATVDPSLLCRGIMHAAGNSKSSCVALDDNAELRARGKLIDEVFELPLADQGEWMHAPRIDSLQSICHLFDKMDAYHPTGEPTARVLGIMLSDHKKKYDSDAIEDCEQSFQEFYSIVMSGKALHDIERDISKARNDVLTYSRTFLHFLPLCISKKSYLSLVPRKTKIRDKVAILSGGRLPFILKPVRNHFKLIKACYMHGYMKGEAWPKNEEDLDEVIIR